MKNAVQWCPDSRYYTDYPRLIAQVIRATDHWRVENFDLMLRCCQCMLPLLCCNHLHSQSSLCGPAAAHFHLYQ